MQELVKELREARLHASAGAMVEAERRIRAALRLFDAAPRASLPQVVRGYIVQAGRAVAKSYSAAAIFLLDEALQLLDEPAAEGE